MIQGFRGGKMTTRAYVKKGKLYRNKARQYPRGILRKKSPDGEPYTELSPITIRLKKKAGSPRTWWEHPLRERSITDPTALVNSLKYRIYRNNNGVAVSFKNAAMNKRSVLLENGAPAHVSKPHDKDPSLYMRVGRSEKPQRTPLPPRPHRQIQPAVVKAVEKIIYAWVNRGS